MCRGWPGWPAAESSFKLHRNFFITNMGCQHRCSWTCPVNDSAKGKDKRQATCGASSVSDTGFQQRDYFVGYINPKGQVFKGTCTQQLQLKLSEPVSASVLNPRSDWVLMPRVIQHPQPWWISWGLRAFWINIKLTVSSSSLSRLPPVLLPTIIPFWES